MCKSTTHSMYVQLYNECPFGNIKWLSSSTTHYNCIVKKLTSFRVMIHTVYIHICKYHNSTYLSRKHFICFWLLYTHMNDKQIQDTLQILLTYSVLYYTADNLTEKCMSKSLHA